MTDELFRPYILLKDIDGKPYWRPYGGEPIEEVRVFHKWELEAQKQFKEKSRSQDELDYVRNACLAIRLITDLLGIHEDGDELKVSDLLESVGYQICVRWYCKDKGIDYKTFNVVETEDEELKVYYQLAMFYIQSFVNTFESVRNNVRASSMNS